MIYYSLSNHNLPLNADKIMIDLTNFLNKIPQSELTNHVLVISLQKVVDYAGDSPLPKITYEHDCST